MSNELIQVETLTVKEVFAPGGVEKIITDLEAKVRAIPLESVTEDGRAEIKSLAYKVARSKTALDGLGKDFTAELKKVTGAVDADRRQICTRLDALRDEVRAPVDQWEANNALRKTAHERALQAIRDLAVFGDLPTAAKVESRLDDLDDQTAIVRDWQEYQVEANEVFQSVRMSLETALRDAEKRDRDRADLERLRKADAERLAAEHFKNLSRKREADRLAREQEQRERDAKIAAQAKQEAEELAAAQQRRAEKAEADAKAAAEKAIRDQEAAVAAERKRIADEHAVQAEADRRRAANEKHRTAIIGAAYADLISKCGLSDEHAKAVVVAISTHMIAHIEIHF